MAEEEKVRKQESYHQDHNPQDFIPTACYFDDTTILNKNGELLQTFRIEGIQAHEISNNLANMRDLIRASFK